MLLLSYKSEDPAGMLIPAIDCQADIKIWPERQATPSQKVAWADFFFSMRQFFKSLLLLDFAFGSIFCLDFLKMIFLRLSSLKCKLELAKLLEFLRMLNDNISGLINADTMNLR